MAPEEFIVYVDNLPDDCIDERMEEQIIFHLSTSPFPLQKEFSPLPPNREDPAFQTSSNKVLLMCPYRSVYRPAWK